MATGVYKNLTDCQNPTTEDFRRFRHEFQDRLDYFREEAGRYREHSNSLIRSIADTLSGAGDAEQTYDNQIVTADSYVWKSLMAERYGNHREALKHIATAEQYLDQARTLWRRYTGRSAQGGEEGAGYTGEAGAIGVATAINLFFGLAVGLHIIGLEIFSRVSDNGVGREKINESTSLPKPVTPPPTPPAKPEADEPIECSLEVNENQGSADVDRLSCEPDKGDAVEEQILAMVNSSQSFHRTQSDLRAIVAEVHQQLAADQRRLEVSELPPNLSPRPLPALIAAARQALVEWRNDPQKADLDLDQFFLDVEAMGPPPKNNEQALGIKEEWEQRDILRGMRASDVDGRMTELYWNYTRRYSVNFWNISDYIREGRGNCWARTKLIVADFSEKVKLPDHQILLVERYKGTMGVAGHENPVVYDTHTGELRDLVTGERRKNITGDLFYPAVFFHAFLKKQGIESPVSDDQLRFRKAEKADLDDGIAHRSDLNSQDPNFLMPDGTNELPGDGPEDAISGPPLASEATSQGHGVGGSASNMATLGLGQVYSLDSFPFSSPEERKEFVETQFGGLPFVAKYESGIGDVLVFQSDEQLSFYNALPATEAKRDYLVHLSNQAILEAFKSNDFQRGLALLSHPTSMRKMTYEQFKAGFEALELFDNLSEYAARSIATRHPLKDNEAEGHEDKEADIYGLFFVRNSLVQTYENFRGDFIHRVQKHALEFILFADRLPPEKRSSFFKLLAHQGYLRDKGHYRSGTYPIHKAMGKVIANKRLIGLEKKEEATGHEPLVIELVFLDDDGPVTNLPVKQADATQEQKVREGKLAEVESPGRKGKKKQSGDDSARSEKARYQIAARTMIDFILEYAGEDGVAARWNPQLSEVFLQVNRNGEYDSKFLNCYARFVKKYSPKSLSEDNPLRTLFTSDGNRHELGMMIEMKMGTDDSVKKVPPDIAKILRAIAERKSKVASARF